MRLTPTASLVVLVAVLGAGSPACFLFAGPTHIEQGQAYVTGNGDYDAFFKEVVDASEESKKVAGDDGGTKAALAEALGLAPDAGGDEVSAALSERAKKLQASGVVLHLELMPEVRLVRAGEGEVDESTQKVLTLLEQRVKASVEAAQRVGALPDKLARLERKRTELRGGTAQAFAVTKSETRSEIERELDAAKDIIARSATDGAKVAGDAARVALELARAVETGAGQAALEAAKKPEPAATAKGKPVPPPRGKLPAKPGAVAAAKPTAPPAKPAGAPPAAPPAKPATKPAKSDDFEP